MESDEKKEESSPSSAAIQTPAVSKTTEVESSSISSGRASDVDSDTDTDSDYSSHDGNMYPSTANFNHGAYDPNAALHSVGEEF